MKGIRIILVLIAAGCYSAGQKKIMDDMVIAKIIKGKSTKADIEHLLGKPSSVTFLEKGQEQWLYAYIDSTIRGATFIPVVGYFAGGADTQLHQLAIMFDDRDVVERIGRGMMIGGGGGLQDVGRNPQPLPQDLPSSKPAKTTELPTESSVISR